MTPPILHLRILPTSNITKLVPNEPKGIFLSTNSDLDKVALERNVEEAEEEEEEEEKNVEGEEEEEEEEE